MITAAVNIWTDGACSGNPGPMGIGVVVVDGPDRREAGVGLGDGTSNIAELRAIEHGLVLAAELTGDKTRPMRVHSDSAYAIGILSKGWKAKANVDLVARLRLMLADFPNVTFVKVRGHAGVVENERCDELATAATAGFSRQPDVDVPDELGAARLRMGVPVGNPFAPSGGTPEETAIAKASLLRELGVPVRPELEAQHAAAMETIGSLRPGVTIQKPWGDGWIDWEVRAVLLEDERIVARRLVADRWDYDIATSAGFHVGLWRRKP